ncbi:MAG: polysaccharide deacetylase family protein [Candidatus Dormiibacterota bacterium]
MTVRRHRRHVYLPVGLVLALVLVAGTAAVAIAMTLGPGAPLGVGFPRVDRAQADTGPGAKQAIVEPPPGDVIPAGHVPVLMYHYIRLNPNPRDVVGRNLSVSPDHFTQQMQFAHDHGFKTITLEQLYAAVAAGKKLDRRTMVLTFDDGYEDFYTTAWPVLKQNGFTATSYVVGDFVGKPGYMTWDQVDELDRAGIEIGAHSLTHPDLTRQTPAALDAQVAGSKAILEQHLGHPVYEFCYPAGRFNPAVLANVHRAGYHDATTTVPGVFESMPTAYYWPRVRIESIDTLPSFSQKLASGFADYQKYGDKPAPGLFPSPLPSIAPSVDPSASPTDYSRGTE